MTERTFTQRSAEDIREAAARLCERMEKDHERAAFHTRGYRLGDAAKRIRRIPLAGRFKRTKGVTK